MRTLFAVLKSSWLAVMAPEVALSSSDPVVVMAAVETMPSPAVRVMGALRFAEPRGAFWERLPSLAE